MEFDLLQRTILLTMAGSRAYGTNRPDSDVDVKGVVVPPIQYRDGFLHRFEQADKPESLACFISHLPEVPRAIAEASKLDGAVFELRKFFALAAEANPNILDALFCDPSDVLLCTDAGKKLLDNKQLFLSTKARFTFGGYAQAQLKRIKGHRAWLLNPLAAPPTRSEYGLPERTVIPADQLQAAQSQIKRHIDGWSVDYTGVDDATKIYLMGQIENYMVEATLGQNEQFWAAGRILGYEENFLQLLDKERHYKIAQDNWTSFQNWQKNRNPMRAKLEAKFGFDGKHGSHLVRLLKMCREILTEGECRVRRPDAKELLEIQQGSWTYDRLANWAEEQDTELTELAKVSNLPRIPDKNKLDALCCEITQMLPPQ